MIHWCGDETAAVMGAFSFIGVSIAWIRAKIHHFFHHRGCKKKSPSHQGGKEV